MALKIYIGDEVLDLPRNCTLEWGLTSPLFNERGSQSLPVTLPATPHNMRLLGFPGRIDAATRHDVRDGAFADGVYWRRCKINLVGVSDDGIAVSLGTDESLVYAEWADRKLRDIPGLPVYTPDDIDPLGTLIGLMNACYRREVELDYHVFPVAVEFDEPADDAGADAIPVCTVLNEVYRDDTVRRPGDLIGTTLYSAERTVAVGDSAKGNTVLVPRGYGITPFLKVGRFLRILFDCYGYVLADNVFDTDPQLRHLVMLNNTADAIVTGSLSYADLLPDCTVNELLDTLRAHFGAVFYLDGGSQTARCVLVRDTLAAEPDDDLTPFHASRPALDFNEPRQLVLSSKSSYTYGDTREESFATFLTKYGALTDTNAGGRLVKGVPKYEQDLFTGTIFMNGETQMHKTFFTSMHWPWNRRTDRVAAEAVDGADTLVPMYQYRGTATVGGLPPFNLFALPLYLSGVRNAHTQLAASAQDDDTLTRSTDLALCFAHGDFVTPGDGQPYGLFYGSPLCYAPDGSHFVDSFGNPYHSSLLYVGESGAYAQYWAAYDRLLRYSNRRVETRLHGIYAADVADFARPKTLFGQPVLIDTLSQAFPLSRHATRGVTLRTMKELSPSEPVPVADVARPAGYWAVDSNEDAVRAALLQDARSALETQYPGATIEILECTWTEIGKHITNDAELPTAEQVASIAHFTYTYRLVLDCHYSYKRTGWNHWEKGESTRTSSTEVTVTRTATAY
ncbi:MAG: hypothetical protein K6B45_04675 [Bacteroidaceae bacterium]|nr:hypothetical protein [Bacteroidaceae bacterium]